MSQFSLSCSLAALSCLLGAAVVHTQLANTNYGYVLGSLDYSRNSREFASFRGVPFAQPPVGDLRFQNPQPPKRWNSPYNATVDAPLCVQAQGTSTTGQEDCLYLNIYVPKVENATKYLLPVMFFIYGGSFESGGSASNMYGPKYFMDKDVILVTINYRIGALGSMTTLDDESPGNFGLKDQVMALRFVNENIEYFGGDKDKVTIFGQSAGACSVSLQLLSPLSDGLFQHAIAESGAALVAWRTGNNEKLLNMTNSIAILVGCEEFVGDSRNLVKCLRGLDAETIVKNQRLVDTPLGPCVTETKTDRNSAPFLEKTPLDYIESGEFKKIPFVIGENKDESVIATGPILKLNETRQQFNANFDENLLDFMRLKPGFEGNNEDLVNNLTEFYLGGDHFVDVNDPTKIQGFTDMVTDRMLYLADKLILSQYFSGHEFIWVYDYAYRANHSYADLTGPYSEIDFNWDSQIGHGDELQFLFESPDYFAPYGLHGYDLEVSEKLLTIWTNFATFGNPDPTGDLSWRELNFGSVISNEHLNYLSITGSYVNESFAYQTEVGYKVERMQLWEKLNIEENS